MRQTKRLRGKVGYAIDERGVEVLITLTALIGGD